MSSNATWIEFGRKADETDEQWAAVCKDVARAWANATGTAHLLPTNVSAASGMETRQGGNEVPSRSDDSPISEAETPNRGSS